VWNFIRYLGDLTFLQTKTYRFSLNYFHPFLCLFPIFGLFAIRKPVVRWCYIYSWLFTIYAFFLIPFQTRYFLPFEMLMAICVASGMRFLSVKRYVFIAFIVLVLVPLGIEINEAREEFTMRREVILGQIPEMRYLVDRRYDFEVFRKANEELPDGSKVLYLRERTFYLSVPHEVIEPRLNFDDARHPEQMLERLREFGYTHVIIELETMSTLNTLDAILDNLDYDGTGGVVGEGELRYVEFDYWPLAISIHADRELTAYSLPAIIDVFGGEMIDSTPGAERYRLDLSPLKDKQYLTAYASLASELRPWHAEGMVERVAGAGDTRLFDITPQSNVNEESKDEDEISENHENKENQ
jgi:hypothetical protein